MYLICCPNIHMQTMIDDLAKIHVTGVEVQLMEFQHDAKNLRFLKDNINQFDYVIIPSPAAIEYAKDAISLSYKPAFISVGAASGTKINKLTHKDVIYPKNGSGGAALFNEKLKYLDLPNKMVLVIKGEGGNDELYAKMAEHNIKWTSLDIYKRILLKLEPDYLKKMLLIDGLQGIIITTGILVEWLFEQALADNCVDLLKNCLFITMHPNIEQRLNEFGASRVLVTSRTERNAIVELIKGFA